MKKKISIVIFIALIIVCVFHINNMFNYKEENILDVSIINLIANPKKFDEKYIRLIGVLEWEFEGHGIYLTKDDYNYGITKNAVWLDMYDEVYKDKIDELKQMNGEYVIVEGVFNSNENGHFDMYSGTIENVTRIELWRIGNE